MKKSLVIIIIFFVQISIAQDYKFGKVSLEELKQATDPDFPEANAAILYRNQSIKFSYLQGEGFVQENEIYERIKIYTKEGFDYATKIISLYTNSEGSNSNDQIIKGLKAVTYNLEGDKIVEDKLKKEGIFEETSNKYWKTSKFTMPNIKEGCIIEFEYTIEAQRAGIEDVEFQQLIPIKKLDFKLKTPEYFKYKQLLNPRASFIPSLTNTKVTGKISLRSRSSPVGYVARTTVETDQIEYTIDVINANLKNIPPLKNESFVDNLSNYQAKLIMELDLIDFPNEAKQLLSTTWEKVTETIYEDQDFGSQLNKKGYYDKDIDAILMGISNPKEKVTLIFNHVKSKVKWNEYFGYTTDQGVSNAYKDGVGNVADINLMLTSMLRYAGLKANPVLVSTKSNGIPLLPTRSGFNYVICAIELEDHTILLDASHKFSAADILPTKVLNWLGRIIRENGSSDWVDLIPNFSSKETISLNIKLSSDLSATGKVRSLHTDYQAYVMRDRFENYTNDQIIENLEKNKGELEISNLVVENMNDVTKPITRVYEFSFQNAAEEIGGKLYISPLLFLSPPDSPFKEVERAFPIDFIYPTSDKFMVNIILPDGYVVETLPKNERIEYNGTEGAFSYIVQENGSMLQLTVYIDINTPLILAADYKQFKQFYQLMIEKQLEKIVLKKT